MGTRVRSAAFTGGRPGCGIIINCELICRTCTPDDGGIQLCENGFEHWEQRLKPLSHCDPVGPSQPLARVGWLWARGAAAAGP